MYLKLSGEKSFLYKYVSMVESWLTHIDLQRSMIENPPERNWAQGSQDPGTREIVDQAYSPKGQRRCRPIMMIDISARTMRIMTSNWFDRPRKLTLAIATTRASIKSTVVQLSNLAILVHSSFLNSAVAGCNGSI
jgi:hypothetical protein